jgi:hypothetical protein
MADRRPVRYRDQLPALRDADRLPVPVVPAPVHQPSALSFGESTYTREEFWERLPITVRQRVEARLGRLLEWWAEDDEQGRIIAVVLGDEALVTVDPTVNASGKPAYRVAAVQLDPSSFRSVSVTGPTGDAATVETGQKPGSAPKGGPGSSKQPTISIPRDLATFLGYLPARAQTLLQEPFLTGGERLDWRHYYLRYGQDHGLSVARLQAWCFLTDLRTVTFAAGTGEGFRDGVGVGAWQLTCWRASRRQAIGTGQR